MSVVVFGRAGECHTLGTSTMSSTKANTGHCGADGLSMPQMHDGLVRSMHLSQNEHDLDAPAKVSAND